MLMYLRWICLLLCFGFLSACENAGDGSPVFHSGENPRLLSAWNVLKVEGELLHPTDRVLPYDLNSPLFTDYAHKFRTIWMPEGVAALYRDSETFDFPVGTIISKTFYYPRAEGADAGNNTVAKSDNYAANLVARGVLLGNVQLMETRLLVRRAAGWVALPYVWNEEQTEAVLKRTGDIKYLNLVADDGAVTRFPYVVPNANQCAGCHAENATTRKIQPIGPKSRHMNKAYAYVDGIENQLNKLERIGFLEGLPDTGIAKNAVWQDTVFPLDARARSYLDINCSHCHNTVGPADTSGLHFEPSTKFGAHLGVCKTSVSAGAGTGNRLYDINPGNPDDSIITFRMESTKPDIMMPELGRSIVHQEGVDLIRGWISGMTENCEAS